MTINLTIIYPKCQFECTHLYSNAHFLDLIFLNCTSLHQQRVLSATYKWTVQWFKMVSYFYAKVASHLVSMIEVHRFPEPVKLFITFVMLSQILCGKVQIPLIFFIVFPGFAVFSLITSNNWKNNNRKFSGIGYTLQLFRVIWKICSKPRRNFYTFLCRKIWLGFCSLTHEIWLSITKVMNDFPYLWCLITGS